VLVVMGAFACKDHFGSTARHLADNGYEVRHQLQHGPQLILISLQQLPVTGFIRLEFVLVIWRGSRVSTGLPMQSYAYFSAHILLYCDQQACGKGALEQQHCGNNVAYCTASAHDVLSMHHLAVDGKPNHILVHHPGLYNVVQ
jgi:hypothetical protein